MNLSTVVISQPMYFPWVGMLEQMRCADIWVHLDDAQFSKGSFMNRVQVKSLEGVQWMTVPLLNQKLGRALNETQLAGHNWQRKHLAALQHMYKDAPFASEMYALAQSVLDNEGMSLAALGELSMESLALYFDILPAKVIRASELDVLGKGWKRVLDICRLLGAKRYVTGHGARNYLDHNSFEVAGIRVEYLNYQCIEYSQLHGAFTPYVTGLDLVANMGVSGRDVVVPKPVFWRDFLDEGSC